MFSRAKPRNGSRRWMVYSGLLVTAALLAWLCFDGFNLSSKGERLPVELSRETMTVLRFPAQQGRPKAVILFASGDGGWSSLEEAISRALQKNGYEVVGIDSTTYAHTDYNLSVLQSDFDTIAQTVLAAYQPHPPPLIIGGYSMGAAQAIAAAGGPHPPQDIVGLLLIDPRSRGRYGLRSADQLDVMPTGPGTFGVDEFSPAMANLRIVQWHAGEDTIDSLVWLDSVTAPHQALVFPGAKHTYEKNRTRVPSSILAERGVDFTALIAKPRGGRDRSKAMNEATPYLKNPAPATAPKAVLSDSSPLPPPPLSLSFLIWVIRVSAAINLICCLLPTPLDLTHWLGPWSPFEISQGRQIRMFMMAVLLMILASGLGRGKRIVWLLTMASLAIAPLLHLGRVTIWPQAMLNLTIIVFLLFHHRYFVVGSNPKSVRFVLIICPLLILVLLAFGTIRLHELRDQTSGADDWGACFQTACELVLVHHSETQKALITPMRDFFAYLRIGGTTVAVIGLFLTLRPVLSRRKTRQEHREKVRTLIDFFGSDPLDSYALLPDKEFFFSANGRAVVPYVLSHNLAIALADPISPPELRHEVIAEYILFCRKQDWEPVFYEASSELLPAYKEAGLSAFKIGEEARLRSDEFHLRGNDFQNLRTARNRAARRGLSFRWYNASHGIDEPLELQLAGISEAWLERKKTREMSFDMGSFTLEDIRRHQVAIALDATGKPLAFATWRPFAQAHGQALDLMRTHPTERNIMDFVLVESILSFQRQGIHDISLGTAPLANTQNPDATHQVTEEKAVHFLYENLNRIYGYRSLFEFKRKYRPKWCGRYVAYRRGAHLPLVGLALVRVHARDGIWKYFFQ